MNTDKTPSFSTATLRISAFCFLLLAFLCAGCTKEAKKNRYLALANRDFAAGHYDRAEIEYLKALQIPPANPVAMTRLGLIYHDQGRFPLALNVLKGAEKLNPEDPELRLKLCLTEFSLRRFKDARDDANRLLQKQPGQVEALLVLAQTTFTLEDVQATTDKIQKLRQHDKDRPGYHLALGALYLRQGQITNAEAECSKALALDPKLPATQVALGNLYWMQKDLPHAEQAFKTGAELSPARSPNRLKYAEFKIKTGSLADAKKILDEITRNTPDYLPAWNYLAQVAFAERRFDDAAALLQKVLAQDRINYDATLLDANVKLNKSEVPQAIDELLRLSRIYDRDPEIQLRLAQAYLLNAEEDRAETAVKQALALNTNYVDAIIASAELAIRKGNAAPAAISLEQLIKQHPELAQAHLLLAAAYTSQNKIDQAIATYRRMQPLFAKSPQVPWLMAILLAQQNKPAEARKACDQSLELAPDFIPPLEQLVNLDLADKKPQAALARVNKQLERRPSVAELQLLLAKICLYQKDYTNAEASLLKAIQLAPDLRTSYILLAQVYVASNKTQQALDQLNSLVVRTNDAAALMQIGMIQESLTNYPAARDAYEKVLVTSPGFAAALNNLAYLYSEHLNQLDRAAQLAEQARRLYPNDPSVADTLGWVYYRKADYSRALPLVTQAVTAAPNEAEIQYHLGMVCYALGQEAPARLAIQRALAGDRDFAGKDEARRRLATLAIDPKTADAATRTLLEKRVQEDPKDSVALLRLAGIYDRQGAPEKAAEAYRRVLAQSPRNATVLARLAQLYSGPLKAPQKALEYAKDAHAAAPDDVYVAQILGHLACETGDYKWASSLLQDAALKLPDQPALHYDLARSYYGLGQLPQAETALQNALKGAAAFDQTSEAKRLLSLLVAYRDPAQRQAVAPQLEAILKASPNYIPALMVNELLQQEKGNFQDARKTLDQVLSLNPLFAPAKRDLAILCFDHFPDDSRTADLAPKARESFPDDPNLAKVLGVLAYRRANYAAAAQYLKQSLQTRKNDGELLYYLGMAQYRLKSPAESKQSLRRALELNLTPQLATDAKRILAELK